MLLLEEMEPLSKCKEYIVYSQEIKNQTVLVAFTLICFSDKCDTTGKKKKKKKKKKKFPSRLILKWSF